MATARTKNVSTSKPESKTTPAPEELDALDLGGGPAQVERFRAAAQALPAASVRPLRSSARLMYANVATGTAAVLAEKARVGRELPGFDVARAATLPDLGLATAWAAEEVLRFTEARPAAVRAKLKRAATLRGLLLANLDGAARAGLVPAAAVKKIHEGRGPFDTAGDCVACAGLFQKYAGALKGKTPVSAATVKETAAVGDELLAVLQPKGARPKAKAAELKAAIELRDRLAALLAQGHAELRRAGGWLFGEERDERVPLLLANAGGARRKKAAAEPAKPVG